MITLAHARNSDIALHLMSKDRISKPHLIDVQYSSLNTKEIVIESLTQLQETNPGISLTEFEGSCHITVNETYELPIVAEIIADYYSSHKLAVTRYSGAHDDATQVETFLTPTIKHRYAQGKYTYPYGTTTAEIESESES